MGNESAPRSEHSHFTPSIAYSETDSNDPLRIWQSEDQRIARLPEYLILFYQAHPDESITPDTPVDIAIVDLLERSAFRIVTRAGHVQPSSLRPIQRSFAHDFLNLHRPTPDEDLVRIFYDRYDFMDRVLFALQHRLSLAEADEDMRSGRAKQIDKATWRKQFEPRPPNWPEPDEHTDLPDLYW